MWKKIVETLYKNRDKIATGIVMALTMLATILGVTSCQFKAEKLECSITGKCK